MSFKIRMKMFIAESRTCVSAESCGKRVLLYRSLSVLFLHIRFLFAVGAADGPQSGLRLLGQRWKDGAASVFTVLLRVSARNCCLWVDLGV